MPSWPSKDPDAVLDYSYRIPLDSGDAVDTYLLERLSGTVVIDSGSNDALAGSPSTDDDGNRYQLVSPIWLSGGADGETTVFKISWITEGAREDEDFITLAIAEKEAPDVTDHNAPTAAHLIDRYPAFAAVPAATIEIWLNDAARHVDDSWTEADYARAIMMLAAHMMTLQGLGTGAQAELAAAGISDFQSVRSGQFSFTRAEGAAASGSLKSTTYGRQFYALARMNRGGSRVTPTGVLPDAPLYPSGS